MIDLRVSGMLDRHSTITELAPYPFLYPYPVDFETGISLSCPGWLELAIPLPHISEWS